MVKCLNFLCLSSPSATFALQHGGFVPREWLAAKGLCLATAYFLDMDVKVIGFEFSNARYQIILMLKNRACTTHHNTVIARVTKHVITNMMTKNTDRYVQ